MNNHPSQSTRGVQIISVSTRFGEQIATRKSVAVLLSEIKYEGLRELVLDFSGVNFISRAVAHELLSSAIQIQNDQGVRLLMNNMVPAVYATIDAVKRSIASKSSVSDKPMPMVGLPVLSLSGLGLYNYLVRA